MARLKARTILVFILGMLSFAVGSWFITTFVFVERPVKDGIIEDWDQICFWQDQNGIFAEISPKGCYSTSCTTVKSQTSTAVIDLQNQKIQLDARFVLLKASRFPLPCIENCSAGNLQFKVNDLIPNEYEVWFGNDRVGEINIFSGRLTPRQCFEKN